MKGSIHQKGEKYFVDWYYQGKHYKIYKYRGEYIYNRKVAEKLRSTMQADEESGTFRIEKYTKELWTDISPYLYEWLDAISDTISPGTQANYHNSIKNHLEPFFKQRQIQLHQIQHDVLQQLLKSIKREGKGKLSVMACLRSCMKYAWKSGRIQNMPPFPDKKQYQIVEPAIQWITEDRQLSIISNIPEEHRPIFLWLKYHVRRPAEAMALHKVDYDAETDSFTVRRSISSKKLVERTKTGAIHIIPCHSEFYPYISKCLKGFSKFFFTNPESRNSDRRYTHQFIERIWADACVKSGESIPLYSGTKHSSCSQYINEKGLSMSELQIVTDLSSEAIKRYAKVELSRKKELMERTKIIQFPKLKTWNE